MKTRHSILAVDDEQENLNLVRRLFRARYDVSTALNADEAVSVLESRKVDLILCDQRMPGRPGVELLEEVRDRWPRVVRILVTAYADMEAAVAAINRGQVRRYVSKPWDNDELGALVEEELLYSDLREENERLARDLEARNRELLGANRELESLDRMKSKLLANLSHELKTPLITIKGYAEMLAGGRAGALPGKAAEFLAGIRRSADRLQGLIGNLLQGARMASESEDLVLTDLDLASWARAAARRLEAQAEEKGVRVEVVEHGPVRITADATSVDRILDNLLSNAIKFNVRGGTVRVELAPEAFEARISVSDTGIGIPEAEQERIFERFYQVDTESGRSLGGTGIGLAIVKEAAERHGGRVRVESTFGKGAAFHVFLPSAAHLKDDTGVFLAPPRWEGFLLVLADPGDSERAGERATLLAEGFSVLSALDLKEARDQIARHGPHAVLFDVRLLDERPPGEAGPLFSIPSVAMLPERDAETVKAALAAGAVGTLLKPFQKKEFLFLLEKALEI